MEEVAVFSDSQGRGIAEKLYSLSSKTVTPIGIVLTNSKLLKIIKTASKSRKDHIVVIGGTVDSLKGTVQEIFKGLEENLNLLRSKRLVCLSTIPKRHDLPADNPIHEDLLLLNNYIMEVAVRMKNIEVIDAHSLPPSSHTKHGLHFNGNGKKTIATLILKAIKKSVTNQVNSDDKTLNCFSYVPRNRHLLECRTTQTSALASESAKETSIVPKFNCEGEGESNKNTSSCDSTKLLPIDHFGYPLDVELDPSQTTVELGNERNFMSEGTMYELLQSNVLKTSGLDDPDRNIRSFYNTMLNRTSSNSSLAQESKYSTTALCTAPEFQLFEPNIHTSAVASNPLGNMKTTPSVKHEENYYLRKMTKKTKRRYCSRKINSCHSTQKMFRRKYSLKEIPVKHSKINEVNDLMMEGDFVKKRLNHPGFPIKKGQTSKNSVNVGSLLITSFAGGNLCFNKKKSEENNCVENEAVSTANIPRSDLFVCEKLSSFFLNVISLAALYLFLTEFIFIDHLF